MALVAEGKDPDNGEKRLLGVARFAKRHGSADAEFALLVSDQVQRQGLGRELMKRLVTVAREEGIRRLEARMLPENEGMQKLLTTLNFELKPTTDKSGILAGLTL